MENEESICPEFDTPINKIFETDPEIIIKQFAIRKSLGEAKDFKTFFKEIIKSRLDFAKEASDPNSTKKWRYKTCENLFEKLFGASPIIVNMAQREEPHPVIKSLFESLEEYEGIKIVNGWVEGQIKTMVTYQKDQYPTKTNLMKTIKMYFKQLEFKVLEIEGTLSTTTKTYLEKLLIRFLKAKGIESVDYEGNPTDEFNIKEMGINLITTLKPGTQELNVSIEFAMDKSNQSYDCIYIKNCLKTFTSQFYYETIDNYDHKTGKPASKEDLKKYNDVFLPGAPFELQSFGVGKSSKIEVYGIKPFVKAVINSLQNILKGDSDLVIEQSNLKNNPKLDAADILTKTVTPESNKNSDRLFENDDEYGDDDDTADVIDGFYGNYGNNRVPGVGESDTVMDTREDEMNENKYYDDGEGGTKIEYIKTSNLMDNGVAPNPTIEPQDESKKVDAFSHHPSKNQPQDYHEVKNYDKIQFGTSHNKNEYKKLSDDINPLHALQDDPSHKAHQDEAKLENPEDQSLAQLRMTQSITQSSWDSAVVDIPYEVDN